MKTLILCMVFFLSLSLGQSPCSDWDCDAMVIRAILDSNDIPDEPYFSDTSHNIIRDGNGRVAGLALGGGLSSRAVSQMTALADQDEINILEDEFSVIPSDIGSLSELVVLCINNNPELQSLPAEIGELTGLTFLDVQTNAIAELPSEIGQLTGIEELVLDNNLLTALPSEIGQISGLRIFSAVNNSLESLTPEIGSLSSLEVLDLSRNSLTELPVEIGQLTNVWSLTVEHNLLASLPAQIGDMSSLYGLRLDYNNLTTVPAELGQISSLLAIYISHNQLEQMPVEAFMVRSSRTMYLAHNNLTDLPDGVSGSRIMNFTIEGNMICEPSAEAEAWIDENSLEDNWRETQRLDDGHFCDGEAFNALTMTFPNGGEQLKVDSIYSITWNTTGDISNVSIKVFYNYGGEFDDVMVISYQTENDGLYEWLTPDYMEGARISITADSGNIHDESDGFFEITGTPTNIVKAGEHTLELIMPAEGVIFTSVQSDANKLYLFNPLGDLVSVIDIVYGKAAWDGKDKSGNLLPNGLYLGRLGSGKSSETGFKVLLSR
ncbi:hypothetical protein ACFL5V_07650 [Fibrobacterota bacterium]